MKRNGRTFKHRCGFTSVFVFRIATVNNATNATSSIAQCMTYVNELVLCVKFLVAALPVAVCFIYGLLFRLPVLLVQVISTIQKTQEGVLVGTDSS